MCKEFGLLAVISKGSFAEARKEGNVVSNLAFLNPKYRLKNIEYLLFFSISIASSLGLTLTFMQIAAMCIYSDFPFIPKLLRTILQVISLASIKY